MWGHGFSDTVNPRVVVGPDSWSSIILLLLLYVQVNWRYAGRITTEVEYPLLPDSTPASVFGFAAIAGPRRPGPITGTHAAGTGCCKCPHHCDNDTVVIPMARFVWFLLLLGRR